MGVAPLFFTTGFESLARVTLHLTEENTLGHLLNAASLATDENMVGHLLGAA